MFSVPPTQKIENRLAHLVNEALLPEKDFPLRLVGTGLEKSEMVGQVARISFNP
jgi:hypothetical protein